MGKAHKCTDDAVMQNEARVFCCMLLAPKYDVVSKATDTLMKWILYYCSVVQCSFKASGTGKQYVATCLFYVYVPTCRTGPC